MVEVHRGDFAVFTRTVEGLSDLIFRLFLLYFRQQLVVLALLVQGQKFDDVDGTCLVHVQN